MLISCSILQKSFENFQAKQKQRENYKEDTSQSIMLGIDSAFAVFLLGASFILFLAN